MKFMKKVPLHIQLLLTVASCLSFSSILIAANISFLKYGLIDDFTESDLKQLQTEYLYTLNSKKPGEAHKWNNKETGNGGEITVIKRYKLDENHCKRLQFKSFSGKKSATSYYNFCLFESQWKFVP
ncbi:hypothetical protein MNBD_GAMMA09-2324 [hydrothermal vent metagenome]|uniref:Surface antigen domain-containing protein n=1 Tax=hydrothermal vent metagenome TaxID=652676 RepID=A0A3B0XYK8_9ZZZZ